MSARVAHQQAPPQTWLADGPVKGHFLNKERVRTTRSTYRGQPARSVYGPFKPRVEVHRCVHSRVRVDL